MKVFEKHDVTCIEMKVPELNKVYAFLVDGMLIDTGPERFESELIDFYEGVTFDQVALTHNDEDHSGTAPWIQANKNVPIYVHPKGIDLCHETTPYPKYRQLTWGKRDPFQPKPLEDIIHSRTKKWEVIDTPGHAEDHVAFFNQETGILFSGDLYVSPKTKVIMDRESIPQLMASIRKVLSYDFGPMFCCHAGYIENGKEKMSQKLEHLENLYGEVKALHEQGDSIEEITRHLFPKNYPIISISEGEWDSKHVIMSIVADIERSGE